MGKKKNKKVGGQTLIAKSISKYFPVFVLPTFVAFCIGFIWPFIQGLYLSFCQFTTVDNAKWNGLKNYIYVLQDEAFLDSFGFTVAFAVVSILSINIIDKNTVEVEASVKQTTENPSAQALRKYTVGSKYVTQYRYLVAIVVE